MYRIRKTRGYTSIYSSRCHWWYSNFNIAWSAVFVSTQSKVYHQFYAEFHELYVAGAATVRRRILSTWYLRRTVLTLCGNLCVLGD